MNHTDKIKRYINQRGITQKEFSRCSGLTETLVSDLLKGRRKFPATQVEKLEEFLKREGF